MRELSTLQDPGCNASNGFWSRDLRSKILLPHDLCKEHLHGYCFQAIVAIITKACSLCFSVVAGGTHVSSTVAVILCGLKRIKKFSFA